MTKDVGVIVVAAGKGERLGAKLEKPYVRLGDRPLLCHCLGVFQPSRVVGEIVLVVHPKRVEDCREGLLRKFSFPKVRIVVAGGQSRQESVARGLAALAPQTRIVVVHDAARPFVSHAMLVRVVRWAKRGFGATVGIPVAQTIKKISADRLVLETPPRELLWEIQTPQAFPRPLIERAHKVARRTKAHATDDAGLVERVGGKVKVILGSPRNLKITNREDLLLAQLLLRQAG